MEIVTIPKVLNRIGWTWTSAGLEVQVSLDGRPFTILLPLADVEIVFRRELAAVGCPMSPQVGAPGTTSGFLATVGATIVRGDPPAVGRSKRKARRARKRERDPAKWDRKLKRRARRRKAFRGIANAAKQVGKIAGKVVKNPAFQAAFGAVATAFPVLAPAAAGLAVATRVVDKVAKGKRAAQKLARGVGIGSTSRAELERMVREGQEAERGIAEMADLAKRGDPQAQRAMGALVAADGVMHQ